MVYLFSSSRTRATLRRGSSLQSTCSSSPTLSELTVLRNYRCHVCCRHRLQDSSVSFSGCTFGDFRSNHDFWLHA